MTPLPRSAVVAPRDRSARGKDHGDGARGGYDDMGRGARLICWALIALGVAAFWWLAGRWVMEFLRRWWW